MKNKQQLQEQLLAEFDAVDKLGKFVGRTVGSGAKAIGSVAGGVAGLGSAIKQGYQAGKQTVGGGGANVQTKQQPKQQQQQKQPSKTGGVMKNLAKNVGQVALDTAAGSGYDYKQGVNPNPTGIGAGLKKADAEAKRKAGLEKKLGTTGTQATATNTAKTAVDKSIARNQKKIQKKQGGVKQSSIKQGIDIAGANQGVANMQKQQAGKTATKVPGQKQPTKTAPVDANKDGKDDKTGKPISQTAQNVGKKTGVNTAKIGGQKVDLNDPKMKGLRAAIEKAAPGSISTIDKMAPNDKAKLKKAIS